MPDSVNTYNTPTLYARKTHEQAYYIQDKWRTTKKLTMNIGFRLETIYGWINGKGEELCQPQTLFINAQCFPGVEGAPDWTTPTPRFSAVYDLRGDGMSRVIAVSSCSAAPSARRCARRLALCCHSSIARYPTTDRISTEMTTLTASQPARFPVSR